MWGLETQTHTHTDTCRPIQCDQTSALIFFERPTFGVSVLPIVRLQTGAVYVIFFCINSCKQNEMNGRLSQCIKIVFTNDSEVKVAIIHMFRSTMTGCLGLRDDVSANALPDLSFPEYF